MTFRELGVVLGVRYPPPPMADLILALNDFVGKAVEHSTTLTGGTEACSPGGYPATSSRRQRDGPVQGHPSPQHLHSDGNDNYLLSPNVAEHGSRRCHGGTDDAAEDTTMQSRSMDERRRQNDDDIFVSRAQHR
ncbi:hypothetical protein COOONC_23757 [Cooperia oncophora]